MGYPNAIVTFARNRIGYTITRSLAQKGIKVVAVDWISPAMTAYSKYCSRFYKVSNPFKHPEKYINELLNISSETKAKVLIPGYEDVFVVAKYRNVLNEHGLKTLVPSYEALRIAHDKKRSLHLARKLGIPVPSPIKIDTAENLDTQKIKFPLVVKIPESDGAKGVFYANSTRELKEVIEKAQKMSGKTPLVQEYFKGRGYGASFIFKDGKMIAYFVHRRLREIPYTGGTSTARESVEFPELVKFGEKLLKALKWNGVAMVEFKVNEKTNRVAFLEINPRFWGSLNQAVSAGVDFPFLYYLLAIGADLPQMKGYKTGVVARWLLGEIKALLDYLIHRELKPLKGFWKVFGSNIVWDDLYLDDPLPFLIQPIQFILELLKKGKLAQYEKRNY